MRERPDALFVGSGAFFLSRRVQLVHLATRHALPAAYSSRDYAEAGGLLSYGATIAEAYRQVGVYAGRSYGGDVHAEIHKGLMEFYRQGKVRSLTTRTIGFDEVPDALEELPKGQLGRTVLVF